MITPCGCGIVGGVVKEAKVDKRTAILEATLAVLTEKGVSGLKMEEVARRAEVGKGTIYLYFKDKQDLLRALVEHRTFAFYDEVATVIQSPKPFFERLGEVLRRRMAWVEEWRGLWAAVAREAHPNPQTWLMGMHERYLTLLEDLIRSGQKEGAVRPDLSPRAIAAVVSALGCSPLSTLSGEAYVEHLLLVFQKGVGR
ncbi:MAG: TetR/AcrR family transcriptional regulator [Thermaceae bacterium]